MEHPGREFGRVGAGIEGAVVGIDLRAQREDLAVRGRREFAGCRACA
jgi:hypothetical protein